MTTASVNPVWGPSVSVTIDDDTGDVDIIVEIDDLEPTRDTTAEERSAGITSLDPPTVSVRARALEYDTNRAAIDGILRAVAASADATDGSPNGIGALVILQMRTALTVRKAMRAAGADI
jgi:hypothetical protein